MLCELIHLPSSQKFLAVQVVAGVVGVTVVVKLDEAVAVLEGDFPQLAIPE